MKNIIDGMLAPIIGIDIGVKCATIITLLGSITVYLLQTLVLNQTSEDAVGHRIIIAIRTVHLQLHVMITICGITPNSSA